ncbi:LTA synthase family protein [Vibrio cholerae]|uniref:LTA synthase family protein n=1 Tax=Vibrio cholerae TaxID=666 RepID=UPI00155E0608|nr:LTA synthase family protein [Vibrio cholerae]MBU5699470.1 LTA synthase family protein [Vibrio cholerae]MDV2348344.1 LTA synthase family protein [Vibrio cholerae]NOE51962.1 sulfatase-like hydrolase/transferase [Vibrio cholerae]GHY01650.1 phosphoglycerol transferase I [Vibrio cholerae]
MRLGVFKNLVAASVWGPYVHLVRMIFIGMLALSFSRLALLIWMYDRVEPTQLLGEILVQGIRADFILMCLLAAVPVLASLFLAYPPLKRGWFRFTYIWSLIALISLTFLELSTPSFLMQYDIRPNRLYIEYLKYPKEVFLTLWHGFRVPLLLGISLTILSSFLFRRLLKKPNDEYRLWTFKYHILAWPLVVFVIFAGVRSTTQHRPANPALFAITADAMVNSLVINSGYSVLYAIYSLKHESRSTEVYGKLSEPEMLEQTRNWPWLKQYSYLDPNFPTLHWQSAQIERSKPLNIVIVLQESLGATFVQSLGGAPVTPNLERLKSEGIWFNNLYSTGTRSVRGIEAVVAGFMPTPAQSVVKLSNSQQGFATLGSILQQQGYYTQFIYGGEAHFDNMRSFFTGNGISDVVDISKIIEPAFVGSWGASDEDLFNTAHQQLSQLHQSGKPFFSLIFTSTNHEPFEFPDGRIDLYEQPKQTAYNAVKYADWAMGKFFEKAKTSEYWNDTVFLVVADHDNRVYGRNLIPVEKFHIPGLILGGVVKPDTIEPVASQIDLAPTLLSLAGVSACHPMDGRDFIADPTSPGRALLQFDNLFALMRENELIILRPNDKAISATYDRKSQHLSLSNKPVSELSRINALAHVQLPSYLYRERKYPAIAKCERSNQ